MITHKLLRWLWGRREEVKGWRGGEGDRIVRRLEVTPEKGLSNDSTGCNNSAWKHRN